MESNEKREVLPDTIHNCKRLDSITGQLAPSTLRCTTIPASPSPGEPVTECFFYPGTKKLLSFIPGFPRPFVRPAQPRHRVGPSSKPELGVGVFSTRDIKAGQVVLRERPLLVGDRGAGIRVTKTRGMSQQEWEKKRFEAIEEHFRPWVERLTPEAKAAFYTLPSRSKQHGKAHPIGGIFKSNGVSMFGLLPADDWYYALCNEISRLNHSCAPNVGLGFDKASFSYEVHALRDIPAGEELFMSYIHISELLLPKENRNTILRRRLNFGGPCLCSSCTQSMEVLSDRRRAAIEECNPTELFERWQKDHTLAANWLLQPCYNQLGRIQREGLQRILAYSTVLRVLMEACICLGDAQNASIWARRLYDAPTAPWQGIAEHMATVGLLRDPDDPAYQEHDLWCARL